MDSEDWGGALIVGFFLTCIAAFIRHVWWIITICMTNAPIYGGQVLLAVVGLVFPPIGVLHGFWLWLN